MMRMAGLRSAMYTRSAATMGLIRRAGVFAVDQGIVRCMAMYTRAGGSGNVPASGEESAASCQYLSLYNYTELKAEKLPQWRRKLLSSWKDMGVLGRVYIAQEGINAQVVVPIDQIHAFSQSFPAIFTPQRINYGPLMDAQSAQGAFDQLQVRIRKQIVADGFEKGYLDLQDSGNAMPPDQWHAKLQQRNASLHQSQQPDPSTEAETTTASNTLVLDVRNFYEHEIGRFDGTTRIMVDTFRDTFDAVDEILHDHAQQHDGQPPQEVMMYCTGGIRCEKVGAYLKQHKGIHAIHKLQGGIVNYQRFLQEQQPQTPSLFKGKNFVFDQRCVGDEELAKAEVVTEDVLGKCFQCGEPCNDHTNCSNSMCGGLMLQCKACRLTLLGACSEACKHQVLKMRVMDDASKRQYRKNHAREWVHAVPNSLTRLQRMQGRSFSTSSDDQPRNSLDLNAYVYQVSSPSSDEALLRELRETTQRDWPKAEQLIDEPQSKALSFLVQLTGAKDVLEVGCFTGYSAISLANGLVDEDGCVTTCDVNAETMAFARAFFDRSSKKDQIQSFVSDGMEFLEACAAQGRQYDLIFVDANKRQYINYFHSIVEHKLLRPQGLLVFDNTLFRGRVLASANGEANKKERIAHGLAEFNEAIGRDPRVVCVLLPLWDGLTLMRQRG